MAFTQTTLESNQVRLEPLNEQHRQGLCNAINDGELWKLHVTFIPHPNDIDGFYQKANNDMADDASLVFVTINKPTGEIVGSTRFMRTEWKHKRLEIGFTFIASSWQKTAINTEAKFLMLQHAFEKLAMNRVELLTDVLNEKSRRAILRIGAKEEGILRQHMVMPDGRIRDSVIHSITRQEWPTVKQTLLNKMALYDSK